MRKTRRFISRKKQAFLVGFSFTFPRFLRISKNRLNNSLYTEDYLGPPQRLSCSFFWSSTIDIWQGFKSLSVYFKVIIILWDYLPANVKIVLKHHFYNPNLPKILRKRKKHCWHQQNMLGFGAATKEFSNEGSFILLW